MSIEAEVIARRYAVRPGYTLVGFKSVGIAVFSMPLRVLALEPREVPPMDEYLLRFLLEEIHTVEGLSNILGLDKDLVQDRLIELRRLECIDVIGGDDDACAHCILTDKGRDLASSLTQNIIQELTLPNVIFHGLLRKTVQIGEMRRQYMKPREAKEAGYTLLRAIPNRYPHPEEIEIEPLDHAAKKASRNRTLKSDREVVAVKAVLKGVHTLYEPAVLLEYGADDDRKERQVAFVVDGKMREDYEAAFCTARGPELMIDILTPYTEGLRQRIERIASREVVDELGSFEDAENLASQLVAAEQRVTDACHEFETSDRADTRKVLRDKIEQLERERDDIRKDRDSRKVKYLWTPEIRIAFWEAIRTAESRLLILSGFISSDVVNSDFEKEIRKTLERGVRVWIGYGFDKDGPQGKEQRMRATWKDAEDVFKRVKKDFSQGLVYRDIGRTHEKRLICDNRFTFGGSFNLLSFSGESRGRDRHVRHEGADLIESPDFCEELYQRYLPLFFT